jgi:hypothetical protein
MAEQASALAHREEIVRLRQPVDLTRFSPRGELTEHPRRLLLLGNYLAGDRRDLVLNACAQVGLECTELGRYAERTSVAPEQEINLVDIVIGEGRSIVEAMACGRAAFVYGQMGGDGWVTPESYADLEALNFAGVTGEDALLTPEGLASRLREYTYSMGSVNRDLARLHHSASRHSEELVALFERLEPRPSPGSPPLRELARMSRVQWHGDSRALGFAHEARMLSSRLREAEARADAAERQLEELRSVPWHRRLRGLS